MADSTQKGSFDGTGKDLVGRVIDGRYHVERRIGEGGFSVTYKAMHLALDVPVAIKVLKLPAHLDGERKAAFIENFLAEGKLLFKLGALHPAIARSFDAGTLSGADGSLLPFIAMEWLDGVSLEAELQARRASSSSKFSLAEALRLLHPVSIGLGVAHDEGIAHRDVKPGNIFLLRQPGPIATKILDFGVAKVLGQWPTVTGQLADTTGDATAFTPAYSAPEQWLRRLGATGPWTDVYAFALVLVEMLAGRRALDGTDGPQLMAACLDTGLRPTPRALACEVSDDVEAVFARALAIGPRERQPNQRAFWSELCRACGWKPASGAQIESLAADDVQREEERQPATDTTPPLSMTSMPAIFSRLGVRLGWGAAGIAAVAAAVAGALLCSPRGFIPDRAEVAQPVGIDAGVVNSGLDAESPARENPKVPLPPAERSRQEVRARRPRPSARRPASASPRTEDPDDLSTHEEFRSRK